MWDWVSNVKNLFPDHYLKFWETDGWYWLKVWFIPFLPISLRFTKTRLFLAFDLWKLIFNIWEKPLLPYNWNQVFHVDTPLAFYLHVYHSVYSLKDFFSLYSTTCNFAKKRKKLNVRLNFSSSLKKAIKATNRDDEYRRFANLRFLKKYISFKKLIDRSLK